MGAFGGLALGALTGGISLLARAKQEKQARAVATDAQNRQIIENQAAMQEIQKNRANLNAQVDLIRAQAEDRRRAASALLAPSVDTSKLAGLGTIATSPLGDTTEANTGRQKLLGN